MAELAYLQVTRVCNQKCVFCSNPANGRTIDWKDAEALVDSFALQGATGIILTGGEPTLFPELDRLIAYARSKGLPPRLITNGQKTARPGYLKSLKDAGLEHLHVSLHSHKAEVQGALTGNPQSLSNIRQTLEQAGKLGLTADINTVINKANAGHLSGIVRWVVETFPFIVHFVWNNMDPLMNQASLNPEIVPRLADFEAELWSAMRFLEAAGRTFRAERVPLCFMTDYAHCSTETRKLVKDEGRRIYFLDEKGLRVQDKTSWKYGKSALCGSCTLETLCAGLYQMDRYYSSKELCPMFVDPGPIIRRIKEEP